MKSRELENRELEFILIDVRIGLPKERSKGPHGRGAKAGEREGRDKNLNRIIIW